ncbi:flagellar biosynthetic protein FliO [Sporolactobacillus terrae]|uniref:Flagellar biosynthetic protein FliZ n=1 Tax=Sporolactobacillus terrae TaxID=269673 RepID=A0A5K7X186_9BACL|nr:flagellar biosynthetic protein FliO [Sporolactobacillus terrae]UAK17138.1 flagellar biosynthetic protein FliO [Sporolactobacillus terrae]BBN98668.1 flagellar biosynthetic protein FliZ [Sporolactobacillus terrae]
MKRSFSIKRVMAVFLIVLLSFGCSSVVYADSENGTVSDWIKENQQSQKQKSPSKNEKNGASTQKAQTDSSGSVTMFVTFIKLIVALLVVLALIYLLYHLIVKRSKRFSQVSALKNMGGVSLGANRSVQLVQIGTEVLVVGVGESVQLLKEIKDPEAIKALLTRENDQTTPVEEQVLKALKWTSDHAFHRPSSRPEKDQQATAPTKVLRQQLKAANQERSGQLRDMLRKVVRK